MPESHTESQDSCLPRHGRSRVERTWSWKRVAYYRWLQAFLNEHPGILDFVWFTEEAWFHRQTSSYGAFSKVVCVEIGREHCRVSETTSRVRFKRSHWRLSITPFEIWDVVCKHVWKPKVDTFNACCDGHVFNMNQGTCVINFMLLKVWVGKLYRHFLVRKLVGHSVENDSDRETDLDGFGEIQDTNVENSYERRAGWFICFGWFSNRYCNRVFHVQLIVAFLLRKFSAFHEAQKFISDDSEEFWRWCITLGVTGFWSLSIVWYSERTEYFESWMCFCPRSKGWKAHTLGPAIVQYENSEFHLQWCSVFGWWFVVIHLYSVSSSILLSRVHIVTPRVQGM
jgi:hypothetical protein